MQEGKTVESTEGTKVGSTAGSTAENMVGNTEENMEEQQGLPSWSSLNKHCFRMNSLLLQQKYKQFRLLTQ
jgi:hypothetical protein